MIVIAGPNGSGKTTVTEQLLQHEWGKQCKYINPDQIARDTYGDWNSEDAVRKAAVTATELRNRYLEKGEDFVFETVLSSEEKVDFILRAKKKGYFVRIFFVCTENPAINAARVARRVMHGGHTVPIDKIISRYKKSIANCYALAPVVDRLYLYDNSTDNKPARKLFRTVNGKLKKKYTDDISLWALPVYKRCISK